MSIKYIFINVNYDENETEKKEFENVEGLREEFLGDEDIFEELLREGFYGWEWGEWHLIDLEDYQ